MIIHRLITLLFAFSLFSLSSLDANAGVGDAAPDFTLRNIKGKQVSLSSLKGKVVLINFWATWCQPCLAEMPHIDKYYKELKSKGFEVLSISTDDARNASKVKPLVKSRGFTFPVLLDKQTKVVKLYNPNKTLPYNVLIDRQGKIAWTKASYSAGEEKLIKEKILEVLETP